MLEHFDVQPQQLQVFLLVLSILNLAHEVGKLLLQLGLQLGHVPSQLLDPVQDSDAA